MPESFLARCHSLIGARGVNMLVRKLEEMRLSLWIEEEMQKRFGSKRKAKEEILARYASFIYMGNGQYGFATAAEYYFGRSLATFTADDADKAAVLAGIAKSPRYYAPSAKETDRVLRRRNQTLVLMAANGFISRDRVSSAEQRPIQVIAPRKDKMLRRRRSLAISFRSSKAGRELSVEDLLQGRIQVYSTVDARVQRIVNRSTGARPRALRKATPERQRDNPRFRRRAEKPRCEYPSRNGRSSVLPGPLRRIQRL